MISIGDRNIGLGLGFGDGAKMNVTEFEEREACSYRNFNGDDDDCTIDPDVALSYIDEKLQDVLGHFRKDFEGGVSSENLGAKFGGYGTFLPSYQHCSVRQSPRTPQKVHSSNTSITQNNPQREGVQTSSLVSSSASLLPSRESTFATVASTHPLKDSANDFSIKNEKMSSARCVEESCSGYETDKKCPQGSERSLRVRIKVGSVNLLTQRNAEIYSGLGLDISPSASADESPIGSEHEVSRKPFNPPEESPSSIFKIMTSFPVPGSLLLSPLPDDLINLSKKQKFKGASKCRNSQQVSNSVNSDGVKGGKHKSSRKKDISIELKNHTVKESQNANCLLSRKEKNAAKLADEGLVKDSGIFNKVKRECSSDIVKVEAGYTCGIGSTDLPSGISGIVFEEKKVISSNDMLVHPRKDGYLKGGITGASASADLDICYRNKILDTELVDQSELNATSHKENGSASESKKKPAIIYLPECEVEDSKPQKDLGKVKNTYRDFFGDIELEQDDDNVTDNILCNNKQDGSKVVEKSVSKITLKENSYGKKRDKPSVLKEIPKAAHSVTATTASGPISEAVPETGELVPPDKEDWVCCDKCHKWRVLPLGTNPDDLPEKWLCSMLNWLPGMNRCSVSEEETTKALQASHQVAVHAGGPRGSPLVDTSMFDQRKRNRVKDFSASANKDGPVSDSVKNNLPALVKSSSFNAVNQSSVVTELAEQCLSKSSALEKHQHKQKENKKLFEKHSGEVKRKRETEPSQPSASKKAKVADDLIHDRPMEKMGPTSVSASGKSLLKNERDRKRDANNKSRDPFRKSHVQSTVRKRKTCESPLLHTSDLDEAATKNVNRKEKKARISKSVLGNETSGSKISDKSKQGGSVESLKRDLGPLQPSQATSSSSKVSGSHKNRTISKEVKGSPVESVSSSPLRFLNQDKSVLMRSLNGKDDFGDGALFTTDSLRKCSDERGSDGSDGHRAVSEVANHFFADHGTDIMHTSSQRPQKLQNVYQIAEEHKFEKQSHPNVSHPKKSGKSSASRSKSKNGTSLTHQDESAEHANKTLKNNVEEEVAIEIGFPVVEQVFDGKGDCKILSENCGRDDQFQHREKHRLDDKANDSSSLNKKYLRGDRDEISTHGLLSHELPLSARGQNDPKTHSLISVSGARKENEAKSSVTDATVGDDILKAPKSIRRPVKHENQSSKSINLTPNRHNVKDVDAPSPARRDSSSHAGNCAVKEAKDLKHLADRLKNSGSNAESISLYFQAALKFLHGASLLESCNSESAKKAEMIMSMQVYSSTAKLCGYCAHEYEKCKDFAAAALAYKLMEVAYMRVIYSSNTNASKDRHELQTALQIVPFGESPSSSASDIDNLNNPALMDKPPMIKGVGSPQVISNGIINSRNRPNLSRMLSFAQDVNYAMEASKKSRSAFAAATTRSKEAISSVKKALDFSFHDVERLLRLVRLAMDAISR